MTLSPRTALVFLCLLNLLNYLERFLLPGLQVLVKDEFRLSDTEVGLLGSSFVVVYMLSSPAVGFLADRWARNRLIAAAALLWSVASGAAGLARSYWQLMASRSAVGIGEAAYATVSPSLLSDLFPREVRGQVLAYFYLAVPVGAAFGIGLGGFIGERLGWRPAFVAVAVLGLVGSVCAALWLPDPPRGATEGGAAETRREGPAFRDYLTLLRIRSYLLNTLGMCSFVFSMGALAWWMPAFYVQERGLALDRASMSFAGATALAGFFGTIAGGWIGDRLQRVTPKGYFLMAAGSLALGVPTLILAILVEDVAASTALIFASGFFLFLNTGPLNAALANVLPPRIRATGFALNIFIIHLFGDVASPPLVGLMSDHFGLTSALVIAVLPMGFGAVVYLLAMRYYAQDLDAAVR